MPAEHKCIDCGCGIVGKATKKRCDDCIVTKRYRDENARQRRKTERKRAAAHRGPVVAQQTESEPVIESDCRD